MTKHPAAFIRQDSSGPWGFWCLSEQQKKQNPSLPPSLPFFGMTSTCPCWSGNLKCHRVWCASLKMSEIQRLVVHRSAKGWREIKGESRTVLSERKFRWCWHFWLSKSTFWLQIHFSIKRPRLAQHILFCSRKCKCKNKFAMFFYVSVQHGNDFYSVSALQKH